VNKSFIGAGNQATIKPCVGKKVSRKDLWENRCQACLKEKQGPGGKTPFVRKSVNATRETRGFSGEEIVAHSIELFEGWKPVAGAKKLNAKWEEVGRKLRPRMLCGRYNLAGNGT